MQRELRQVPDVHVSVAFAAPSVAKLVPNGCGSDPFLGVGGTASAFQ